MNKKEFYEAPEWALRTVWVERSFLKDSDGIQSFDEDDTVDDTDGWSTGN